MPGRGIRQSWTLDEAGVWQPVLVARFTGDANPAMNINSGVKEGRYFLATGGATENTGTKLRDRMTIEAPAGKAPDWKPTPVVTK